MQQGEAILLTEQLGYRFGKLPAHYLERISRADATRLLKWAKKVFEAQTLEDIFHD